jgi:hypothetical protein
MADEEQTPVAGQSEVAVAEAPVVPEAGQADSKQEAPKQDKFEGKSAEEISTAYKALEAKLGEQSKEVGQTRTQLAEMSNTQQQLNYILQVIGSDPKLYQEVDKAVRKAANQQGAQTPTSFTSDDTRTALESQIINDFSARKGIVNLPVEEQKQVHTKVGAILLDLLDPGGKQTVPQVLSNVSLQKLPRLLDYAYTIVANPAMIEQAKAQALAEKESAEQGAIGGIASGGDTTNEANLTREEREVAKKMGVSEEKWLEQKKKIIKGE